MEMAGDLVFEDFVGCLGIQMLKEHPAQTMFNVNIYQKQLTISDDSVVWFSLDRLLITTLTPSHHTASGAWQKTVCRIVMPSIKH